MLCGRGGGIRIILLPAWLCLTAGAVWAFQPPTESQDPQEELFAARYDRAAELYSKQLAEAPQKSELYYGLVKALIKAHRGKEAYAAAERAAQQTPQTAALLAAVGLADYRKGDLAKAEDDFRAALKLDPQYPGALAGLSSIFSAVSKFKSAQDLALQAYARAPKDPELMLAYANSLKGAKHIAELERIVEQLDPASEMARRLRAHVANDKAEGDRKLRRLTSPYEASRIKMVVNGGPGRVRYGVRVQLNGKETVTLLLDTGASGIAVSPKMAKRAGLEHLGAQTTEAKGIGNEKAQASLEYLAAEVRVGNVTFADYPVNTFRSAQSPDYDGLIGADVFKQFLVDLDFPKLEIRLEPRAGGPPSTEDREDAADTPAAGFHRAFRAGDNLALTTSMNDKLTGLFLVDSGSTVNAIDTATAKRAAHTSGDSLTTVRGVQGKVDKVSRADHVSLVFGGLRQDNADLIAFDMTPMGDEMGMGFAGILGLPVLGQLNVTIDYVEGTLKLEYLRH